MIDEALRPTKDRVVGPIARRMAPLVRPGWITLASLLACTAAGAVAATGRRWPAVALWLFGRLLDGIDGSIARERRQASDLGGYLDMMADTAGYAAVPLGLAVARADAHTWAACAVLLASFYINTMSWTYLSAIAEKRSAGAAARGERTTIHMPTGLIEGTETIVLFTLMLALPAMATGWFVTMSVLVAITVTQRLVWAQSNL